MEMEEHVEALPQEWIVYYKDKFNTPAFQSVTECVSELFQFSWCIKWQMSV